MELVFDALTMPAHIRHWWATGGDTMTVCDVDLRVGGDFHHVFVTPEGVQFSFRGTFLEVERPFCVVNTWLFEGWPGAWAEEHHELSEAAGVTTLKTTMTFQDLDGRAHLKVSPESSSLSANDNGHDASLDALEELLHSLVNSPPAS
ncbi:MAG: SRPBCC domain-containing protein [Acidobacteria bacterium]|jgi:uncharacterized protein YndB with AHSA1/START domain|nr:SRPBCC domain-containing protein [Acidobacteriota bacterium]